MIFTQNDLRALGDIGIDNREVAEKIIKSGFNKALIRQLANKTHE